MSEAQAAYYIVIPGFVRANKKISSDAKLLYGEIAIKCNLKGYCYASNNFFAELFGCNVRSVQRYLKELEDAGFIECELIRNGDGTDRKIFLTEALKKEATDLSGTEATNLTQGVNDKNDAPPHDKNDTHNNKNLNKEFTLIPNGIKEPRLKKPRQKTDKAQRKKPPRPAAPPPWQKGTWKKFTDIYSAWFAERNEGSPPNFKNGNGEALKTIISYLRDVAAGKAKSRGEELTPEGMDAKAVESWEYIFKNWYRLDTFLQGKTRLIDINSNLQNILDFLRNGNSKTHTNGINGHSAPEKLGTSSNREEGLKQWGTNQVHRIAAKYGIAPDGADQG